MNEWNETCSQAPSNHETAQPTEGEINKALIIEFVMSNDPRLEKFYNYNFAAYCADQAEITRLRAELKAQREIAASSQQEVRRVTGELTHLQESVVKPMEKVLIPLGLYNYQSYAECITATVAKLDRVTGERDALRKLQADVAQT